MSKPVSDGYFECVCHYDLQKYYDLKTQKKKLAFSNYR